MNTKGIQVKQDEEGARIKMQCEHQKGLLYVIPSEANWVCSTDLRHAHSVVGFLKELGDIDDPRIKSIMQRWGIYFRNLGVLSESEDEDS